VGLCKGGAAAVFSVNVVQQAAALIVIVVVVDKRLKDCALSFVCRPHLAECRGSSSTRVATASTRSAVYT
jgi:hypothetical protein